MLLGCKAYRLGQMQNQSQKPPLPQGQGQKLSLESLANHPLRDVTCLAVEFYLSFGLSL